MNVLMTCVLAWSGVSLAAPPEPVLGQVPVQGFLSDADGVAIDGEVVIDFTLVSGDGTEVWDAERRVDVDRGAFTVFLGEQDDLDLRLFQEHPGMTLEVAVDGESFPPLSLGHAARAGVAEMASYADVAADAETLGGLSSSDFRAAGPVDWSELTGVPADQDTTYSAGDGLTLAGTTFDVDPTWVTDLCYDDPAELLAVLDAVYRPAGPVDWSELTGVPADQDTTYSAGDGLTLAGTTFDVDPTWVTDLCYDDPAELRAVLDAVYRPAGPVSWADLSDVPSDLADGDDDTTYTAGDGLQLTGTAFSVDEAADAAAAIQAVEDSERFVEQPTVGAPLSLSHRTIEKDLDAGARVIRYHQGDTELDRLSLEGLTPGLRVDSDHGRMVYVHGDSSVGRDSVLYVDLEGMGSIACMMVPNENDSLKGYPREHATDVGNSYVDIWGETGIATLVYSRIGYAGQVFFDYERYEIVCL